MGIFMGYVSFREGMSPNAEYIPEKAPENNTFTLAPIFLKDKK